MTKIEPLEYKVEKRKSLDGVEGEYVSIQLQDVCDKINDVVEKVNIQDRALDVISGVVYRLENQARSSQRISIAATILAGMMVNHCGEDADGGAVVALQYADALIKAGSQT